MKKYVTRACVALLATGVLLVVAACSSGQPSGVQTTNDGRVTYEGAVLTVTLEENPTTGYLWVFDSDTTNVKALDDEFVAPENKDDMVGAPGTHIYRFEGVSGGTTMIDFSYERSWEEGSSADSLSIEVVTSADGTIESATVK